jgi:hypothetical protein
MVPPGVVFHFEQVVLDGSNKQRTKITQQTAGTPGGPLTIYATFSLGPCDTVPTGAATAYLAALATAQWEGAIVLTEQDCTGQAGAGSRIRITNGQSAWASMDAVVQRVTEELDTGRTTIDIGPPAVLGMDDFVGLITKLRNRPASTALCQVAHNGTSGVPVGKDDNDADVSPPVDDADKGVTGPATGNKPGEGSPTSNASGGVPSGAAGVASSMGLPSSAGESFGSVTLTLCDDSTVVVVTGG